jgi:hypothetical protein
MWVECMMYLWWLTIGLGPPGQCGKHADALAKTSILCALCTLFHDLIYWWFLSNWQFQFISIARWPFWLPFQSFQTILIYFDHFDLFWFDQSISIHLDSGIKIAKTFWSRAGHFDLFWYKIKIAKIKPVRHPAHHLHGCMCTSHLWFPHLAAKCMLAHICQPFLCI